jgi:hypothetical protein
MGKFESTNPPARLVMKISRRGRLRGEASRRLAHGPRAEAARSDETRRVSGAELTHARRHIAEQIHNAIAFGIPDCVTEERSTPHDFGEFVLDGADQVV